jgi:AcrR family transcriptional regulator
VNKIRAVTKRAEQRAQTRERIVAAAADAFAELGFRGASTREIAKRADANQGLITYHFHSKEELWRAAADRIFEKLRTRLGDRLAALESQDPRESAREAVREYVRFVAAHPELFWMMVEEGKRGEERMEWLVDTHVRPLYEDGVLREAAAYGSGFDPGLLPHLHYVLAGAASLIFAVAPECRRLTGLDPETPEAVATHAEFLARLLVPDAPA